MKHRNRAMTIDEFVKDYKERQSKVIPLARNDLIYVTTKEYAAHIRIHPVTVLKWLSEGRIEGAIKAGKRWKIPLLEGNAAMAIKQGYPNTAAYNPAACEAE